MTGPITAVSPPANVKICLIGFGSLVVKSIMPSITLIKNVCTLRNSSPIPARSAFNPCTALLYFPEADSVTMLNSRPATFASS